MNSRERIHGLDTLRAAAILAVLLSHYPKPEKELVSRALNFGWTGVDLFFVLSGFLIGGQLFKDLAAGETISLKAFYLRRFLRTLPAYYVVLGIYFWLSPAPGWRYAVFAQNFELLHTFQPSWSLCVEEQFYVGFPVLILLLRRVRISPLVIPFAGAICLILRVVNWASFRPDLLAEPFAEKSYLIHIYCPTYCRLDGIAFGVGLAGFKYLRPRMWAGLMRHGDALFTSGLTLLTLSLFVFWRHYSFLRSTIGFLLLAVSFGLLTASAVSQTGFLARYKIPGTRTVATLAYSLYLTHSLALMAIEKLLPASGWAVRLATAIALMALSSTLLYFLVEAPMLAYRDRLLRRFKTNRETKAGEREKLVEAASNAL
ncbi:MAG: acyltransferase [Acidobacteriia bacterium]|nr:acyltransferase [Terriglobia bacterium]